MSKGKSEGKGVFITVHFSSLNLKEKSDIKDYFSAFCNLLFDKFDLSEIKCSEEIRG